MRYTYYPASDSFHIPATALQQMLHRVGSPKERIEVEDTRENERRITAARLAPQL